MKTHRVGGRVRLGEGRCVRPFVLEALLPRRYVGKHILDV